MTQIIIKQKSVCWHCNFQIAIILGAVDELDQDNIVKYVSELQQDDGSFVGDQWKEVDTRLIKFLIKLRKSD